MQTHPRDLTMFTDPSLELFLLFSVLLVVVTFTILSRSPKLHEIPTVGSTTWIGSYWSAIKNLGGVSEIVQEGYDKYKDVPFKIPTFYNWIVVVSSNKLLEEVRRAPNGQLSADEANNDFFKTPFTLGHRVARHPYHFLIIKTHLNRQLMTLFRSIENEIAFNLSEAFGSEDSGRPKKKRNHTFSQWLMSCRVDECCSTRCHSEGGLQSELPSIVWTAPLPRSRLVRALRAVHFRCHTLRESVGTLPKLHVACPCKICDIYIQAY